MDDVSRSEVQPAVLSRRMQTYAMDRTHFLGRDSSRPPLRLLVEARRGEVRVELEGAADDARVVQWTQNGTPIPGALGPLLYLTELTTEDSDLYYALVTSAEGEVRSQAFLLVVAPGHPVVNLSVRGRVTPEHPLIGGFVVGRVSGPVRNKAYLIRAIGSSLAKFGIETGLALPEVLLSRRGADCGHLMKRDRQAEREWARVVGAAALPEEAGEFVARAELPPGAYSLVAASSNGEAGDVLLEVFEMPQ